MSAAEPDRLVAAAAERQRRAADPEASAWVGASAGTGKTRVLTDRVLRLLLARARPERLLCLTFTKAAAAEMRQRLADSLRHWATLDDEALAERLRRLLGRPAEAGEMTVARRLFARVLDTPGGLKIQTIHAFCQSLLARFPLEAGVAPHFRALDERGQQELLFEAFEGTLAAAGADGDGLLDALSVVTGLANEEDFRSVLGELIKERGRLEALLTQHGSAEGVGRAVAAALGVEPGESAEAALEAACRDEALDLMGLRLSARALLEGKKSDVPKGEAIARWLEEVESRPQRFAGYLRAFFTADGKVFAKFATKEAEASFPGLSEIMGAEAERLRILRERLNAIRLAEATRALVTLAADILTRYQRRKADHAVLDYEDLILRTRSLLARPGLAAWVLFKLDGGLDHLLVDEAQDTNPDQWAVIESLTSEFFAGEGAYEARGEGLPRTVFAVGDAKQSIFGFQRADPHEFGRMEGVFAGRVKAVQRPWAPVALSHSFRSADAVLKAVDETFRPPAVHRGVALAGRWLDHEPVRVGQAGLVELWPPAPTPEEAEEEGWAPPLARSAQVPSQTRLARLIAARIAAWLRPAATGPGQDGWLDSKARPVGPGDVLILVRRRNAFVEELVRALKQRDVPVAGVDRMVLSEQLAVMDLIALGRVLLLPEDDLTLACLLKSPLIGLDEETLFRLCWRRPGSLWDSLRRAAAEDADCAGALAFVEAQRARADFVAPYELYAELLEQGGRRRLLARLGQEAADPIEEFLGLALAYEREHTPSLEGFLHWVEQGEQEIKRDLEQGQDRVRVMTAHAAKGLQAPIVILPDTLQKPQPRDRLLWLEQAAGAPLPLWLPRKELGEPVSLEARNRLAERQDEEHRRLLYVAMTRAEDRLYLCGWQSRRGAPEDCWYKLAEAGLAACGEALDLDFSALAPEGWSGPGWRLATRQRAAPETESRRRSAGAAAAAVLPDWLREPPPAEAEPPQPLAPSRPAAAEPPSRSPLATGGEDRFRRGLLIHRLLQSLPELPAGRRRAAAERFLAAPVHGLGPAVQAEILAATLGVLERPELAPLFGPGSRAEAPVIGVVPDARGRPQVVSGRIDRLCVTPEQVLVLDFKTQRPAPAEAAAVAPLYLQQLAVYRAILRRIYPDRPVACALLWTDGPRLMPVADALLDRHAP
ncbi:DNA helicase/exodeoxyribonuclease V, subunit A [Tistlia consotensis]|uniref:DNA 3'-5' helicase n=1 Tax=Tistlia consotensis USBA 355 TaxID=560819 RepID=A0A1Y6B652_9PROT|nr:double-strand break repair helicase AddA [Tistlia consotensis]SME94168.1 DNA helicase/exodeoxyribonuclease V, subunit A [Tistlia consotensis USBA 355]SNR29099.1 DNA helicase/exodeoxyribonuclease V, subunit A [Tistlia consotensis]